MFINWYTNPFVVFITCMWLRSFTEIVSASSFQFVLSCFVTAAEMFGKCLRKESSLLQLAKVTNRTVESSLDCTEYKL